MFDSACFDKFTSLKAFIRSFHYFVHLLQVVNEEVHAEKELFDKFAEV